MGSLGERLRQARQKKGIEISRLAEETRISARYLEAIENDDISQLPGGFFTKAFIQQYARTLGVPMEELRAEFDGVIAHQEAPLVPGQEPAKGGSDLPPVYHHDAVDVRHPPRRKMAGAVAALTVVVVACSALYALWLRRAEPAGQGVAPAARTEQEPEIAKTTPPRPALPGETSEPPVPRPPPSLASVPEPDPVPDSAASAAQLPSPAEGPLWFRIAAREATWVNVTTDGKAVFTGILQPTETKRFAGVERATLRIGNAGGLEIVANGKPLGPLGSSGQVRVVTLTPNESKVSLPLKAEPRNGALAPDEPAVD